MSTSLDGIRVVDLTSNVAGPFATQVLGDMGADVIKVERPSGDDARAWGLSVDGEAGLGVAFSSLNRNKRSIVLDLRTVPGRYTLRTMVEQADVLIQNLRPGALDRLGFTWDVLHELNPRLVYCEITGFGAVGPMADRPAYDVFMQAYSGLMSFTGEPGRPPVRVPVSVLDKGAGLWAVIGVMNALRLRDRTGVGARIQTSLLETAIMWEANQIAAHTATGEEVQPTGSALPGLAPYEAFPALEGYLIIAAGNERLWQSLCRALQRPELADDPRFASNAARCRNRDELNIELVTTLMTRTAAEWAACLTKAGVPGGEINTVAQVLKEEQVKALGILTDALGDHILVHTPLLTDGMRFPIRGLAPGLGQHGAEILAELGHERSVDPHA